MEEEVSNRNSVWSQFHSPVLESATVVELERLSLQDKARQVEISKVRQSIEEMSMLLAEMQSSYNVDDESASYANAGVAGYGTYESDSPSEAYVTAYEVQSPQSTAPSAGLPYAQKIPRKPSPAFGGLAEVPGPQRKPRVDTTPQRESLAGSVYHTPLKKFPSPVKSRRTSRGEKTASEASNRSRRVSSSSHGVVASNPPAVGIASESAPAAGPFVPDSHDHKELLKDSSHRHHQHPRGHAYSHSQQTCKHPKAEKPRKRSTSKVPFTQHTVEQRMDAGDFSIDTLGLPSSERKLLERFISALSKLSVEVQMDEAKRQEGRRRMNNAIRALEGWI